MKLKGKAGQLVTAITLALGLSVAAASAQAAVITINFDDLSPGIYPGLALAEQYASLGVHFSSTGGSPGAPFVVAEYPFLSAPNAGFLNDRTATITFDQDVSNVSIRFIDTEIGTLLATIKAFDASNMLLGTATAVTPDNTVLPAPALGLHVGILTLDLNFSGIRSVTFTDKPDSTTFGDGAAFDDITFTVPEPASLALLGLGLAGLGFSRRKKT